LKTVASSWEVHRLREILPIASRMPNYFEKSVIQKRSSHV
jgi:hypothetical protein